MPAKARIQRAAHLKSQVYRSTMSKPACFARPLSLTRAATSNDTLLFAERKARSREETMKSAAIMRFAAMLASAITLFASFATPARAETFEFAVWYSDRDFYAAYARLWASEIEKRTEGRVKFKLHFSGSLVAAKETVNAVRTGAAGGGTTSASFVAGLARPVAYFEALFWIPGDPKIALDTIHKLQEPTRKLLEQRGLKLMFNFPSAGLVSNCSNGHIKAVSDWKGKKVRSAGRWQGVQLGAVGASAVALDPGEVYVALQQKTVDCILFLANLTLSSKVYEVAPYITYWRDGANSSMYYLNMAQWNKVSPADQKIMLQVSDEVLAAGTMKMA
ncbi:MAG TPA: TRAP transporter substrate-binding protein DctP, partial [Reyranella sp.]|nr:TRAP transporter substrate-binding protein DctP [Reyranella sp.]